MADTDGGTPRSPRPTPTPVQVPPSPVNGAASSSVVAGKKRTLSPTGADGNKVATSSDTFELVTLPAPPDDDRGRGKRRGDEDEDAQRKLSVFGADATIDGARNLSSELVPPSSSSADKPPRRPVRSTDPRRKLSVFGVDGAMDGARLAANQQPTPTQGISLLAPGIENLLSPTVSESFSNARSFSAIHPIKQHAGIVNVTFPTTSFPDTTLTPFRCYAMSSRVGASMRGDKVNQDRPYSCVPFNGDTRSAVFAVFDGHGYAGDHVAQYLTEHVEECVLSKKLSDKEAHNPRPFAPDSKSPNNTSSAQPTQMAAIVSNSQQLTRAKTDPHSCSSSAEKPLECDVRQRSSSCPGDPQKYSSSSGGGGGFRPRAVVVTPDGADVANLTLKEKRATSKDDDEEKRAASKDDGEEVAGSSSPMANLDDPNEVGRIFTDGFEQLEENLIGGDSFDTLYSGSTCICLLMHEHTLYTINVGDSRAVMGRTKWYTKKTLKAVTLSRDHSPGIRAERKRIQAMNGRVHATITPSGIPCGPPRVWLATESAPGLAMSRSFGDELAHSVGVIAVPEIKRFEIKPKKDKLIVLGSDGLFEFMSNKEIVNIAYQYDDPSEACERLCGIARQRWIDEEDVIDDITAIVIYLR